MDTGNGIVPSFDVIDTRGYSDSMQLSLTSDISGVVACAPKKIGGTWQKSVLQVTGLR